MPLYAAVMLYLPAVSNETVSDTEPFVNATTPRLVPSARNSTLPAALEGPTVAVNVTGSPAGTGLCEDVSVTEAAVLVTLSSSEAETAPE